MTSLLEKDEKAKLTRQVTLLKEVLTDTLEFSRRNLMLFNGRQVPYPYLLDLFSRFRYNTEGVLNQIDSFQKDYRLKICISEIMRSISADILTVLYLLTFHDNTDCNNDAIINELNVINSEYLRFLENTIPLDHSILQRVGIESPTLDEKMSWFRNLSPELLNSDGKIKSRKDLRSTTKEEIKKGLKEGMFLSENEKFQRITEKGYQGYGVVFVAFKYYSQFHHFNLMSRKLIEEKPSLDIYYMSLVIDAMLEVFALILHITETPNPNFMNEIELIRNKIQAIPTI